MIKSLCAYVCLSSNHYLAITLLSVIGLPRNFAFVSNLFLTLIFTLSNLLHVSPTIRNACSWVKDMGKKLFHAFVW